MNYISKEDLKGFDRLYRANLINSCSGYKSANLIGTLSAKGVENIGTFSSVTHLGSDPALLGFILRPPTVPRHTYENILKSKYYTINHIAESFLSEAHHCSAKYAEDISEFDKTGLTPKYRNDWPAPFVAESPVQIMMKYVEEIPVKVNGTILMIGEIQGIYVKEEMLQDDGFLHLEVGDVASINGLDAYAIPEIKKRFNYTRPDQPVTEMV
ncbi:flavin reductase family protein [Jiulongibacter sediminis]|jgi:flavin reductase (DIM6/NTAB) family NADH-FMN oxidoreductase RutF|uniref:flavin reductase family protein n=1 Tax=Jiulongibacter sediminis TaxID=1605367 RepID=UPI0026E93DDE|nr:flavin reductase [Jiulongibacter sediminis]